MRNCMIQQVPNAVLARQVKHAPLLHCGLCRDTEGFSCSDLMQLCQEAAMRPVQEVRISDWLALLFRLRHCWYSQNLLAVGLANPCGRKSNTFGTAPCHSIQLT